MAFPQIETGYKPEFGLGALYQGFNAANADQMSEQDILKVFLANQREQQQQPLDTLIKQWDAAHAQDKLNNPEYRNSMLQGYMGQMNSAIAAGKKAMGTVDSEIPAVNQENVNRLFMGKTLEDWNKLRLNNQQPEQNQIDFPIQNNNWGGETRGIPLEGSNGQKGFNFGTAKEALQNPNLTPQQKLLILKDAQKRGESVLSTFKQPQVSVDETDKLQNVLVNTPEQLQHIARIQEQGKNAMGVADTRGQYLVQAALARLQGQHEKPLTLDQAVAKATRIIAGIEEGDKQAAAIVIQEAGNYGLRKNPITWQEDKLNLPNTAASGTPINSPSVAQKAGIVPAPGYSPGFANMVNGNNKPQIQQSNLPPGVTIKK